MNSTEELDRRQMTDEQEVLSDQESADRSVLARMRKGETHYRDYLYMAGRLGYKLNQLEN